MPTIAIDQIKVKQRQRKADTDGGSLTLEGITEMATSLKEFGLLSPIILTKEGEDFVLVAGFTRLQGAMHLGWTEIDYTLREDLDDIAQKEIELEENIRRKQLEWFEEAAAIAEIHALKGEANPEWSYRKTASVIGKSAATVSQALDLAKALKEDPTLKDEKSLRSALQKRKTDKQMEKRREELERKKAGKGLRIPAQVKQGDALDLIRKEKDESFDAIITNLPFGVDFELKGGKKLYVDEEGAINRLVQNVVRESFRILKDNSWLVAWFDIRKITYNEPQKILFEAIAPLFDNEDNRPIYQLLYDSMGLAFWLEDAGFSYVTKVPAIWIKPNKTAGIIGDPRKGLIVAYEAFIFAAKGNAVLMKQGLPNVMVCNTPNPSERIFEMQMPVELCEQIISMTCLGGSRILDPFAGSASIGIAALNKQCEFLGFELDKKRAKDANMRLGEHIFAQEKEDENGTTD